MLPRGCAPIGKLCCWGLRKYERGEKRHTRQYSCGAWTLAGLTYRILPVILNAYGTF